MTFKKQGKDFFISTASSEVPDIERVDLEQASFLYMEQSTANSNSFKIAQKTAFEAKGRLYTTGKVIQRLFIIDLYTELAIYRYR